MMRLEDILVAKAGENNLLFIYEEELTMSDKKDVREACASLLAKYYDTLEYPHQLPKIENSKYTFYLANKPSRDWWLNFFEQMERLKRTK